MTRSLATLFAVLLLSTSASAGPPRPATEEDIRALIARPLPEKPAAGQDAVVLLDESDVMVKESGLAVTRRLRLIRILGPGGIKAFSVLREGFDPNTNRVAIDAVRVHRAGGEVKEVALTGIITQPTRKGSIFWSGSQHLLDLPRLMAGDTLEIRTRRIGYNIAYLDGDGSALSGDGLEPPMPGHWYEVTRFVEGRPVLLKRYSVHLPKDLPVQYEVYNGPLETSLWMDGEHTVYTFVARNVPPFKGDPHMASRDDCVTKLVMATLPTWEEKSRWFERVNAGQFEADDAIRAKVAEITENLPDRDAKIAACLHWVADHIRYVGTSRGPCEGFTLHRGIETFHDRGGVCKDIAGMLITMLRVLGLDAYPALTMAGPRVEEIPADQFNHTVAVIRHSDGSFQVLDPTWSPVSRELWSSREATQGLVYGTPEGEGLTVSPFFTPEENAIRAKEESELGADGTLQSRIRMELNGYPGTYLRRNLNRRVTADRPAALRAILGLGPTADLTKSRTTDPLDYSENARVNLEVTVPLYASGGERARLFKLPLLQHPLGAWLLSDLRWSFPEGERRFPVRLRATRLLDYSGKVVLPPGFTVTDVPKKREIDSAAASLEFTCRLDGNVLRYDLVVRAKKHYVPVSDYAGLVKVWKAVDELSKLEILCRPKGGDDVR
jgi:Domain of Unknown Function with PDB structure (DUF3857)/Transglutaminase-like superfamily